MSKQIFTLLLVLAAACSLSNEAWAVPAGPGGIGDGSGTSSLQLWLKADYGVQKDDGLGGYVAAGDTEQVRRWLDASGYSNHAVQNTAANRPTYDTSAVNGQPALHFDPTTLVQFLTTPHFMNFTDPQIYVVGRKTSGAGNGMAFSVGGHNNGVPRVQLRYHGNNSQFWMGLGDGGAQSFQTLPARATEVFNMASYQLTGNTMVMRYNSEQVYTETNANWTTPTFNTGNVPTIGKDSQITSYNLNGDVAEIIIFSSPLTSIQRVMIDNALSAKYNLTLFPGANRYNGDLPGNGDYDFDVFGVGNDGTSSLLTNKSAGLQISANALVAGQYALAGHQGGETGTVGEGMFIRWERDFFVDVTGVFDATLTFDFSDAGLDFDPSYNTLLYSDTLGGPFTPVEALAMYSGDQVSFALSASQFLTGYYALASMVPEPGSGWLLGMGLLALRRRKNTRV